MLTSVTFGMLESGISVCQILVLVFCVLAFLLLFIFLLNNIEVAFSGNFQSIF